MGIFGRMKTLIKANLNDMTSKAENPELILTQLISDMEDQLGKAKLEVRDAITDQKQLEKKLATAQEEAQRWEDRARSAVTAGRDDLAREALGRKQQQDDLAAQYETSIAQQKSNCADLRDALRQLSAKIEEAKRKKSRLVARQKRVEAQTSMATTATAVKSTSAFDTFESHAARIEEFEVQVAADAELSQTMQDQDLERKFGKLTEDHGADDALAALKAKMGYDEADD